MSYADRLRQHAGPMIIAHRGIWASAPENSLAALECAISNGHEVVEIDIRRSADGVLMLMHDDSLRRTTGHDQPLEHLPAARIARLALRRRDGGPGLPDQTVPTLAEALDLCRGKIFLHLDAKDRAILPQVVTLVQKMGMTEQVDVWGDLRSDADLSWFGQIVPRGMVRMARLWLDDADLPAQQARLFALRPEICELRFSDPAQIDALVRQARQSGISLMVNTLTDIAHPDWSDRAATVAPGQVWGRLINAGAKLFQTDRADALRDFLKTKEKP